MGLIDRLPNIRFIDGARWPSEVPPTKNSIDECSSSLVYLWNEVDFPVLPNLKKAMFYQGPTSGVVIQYDRCGFRDNRLSSGSLNVGFSDPVMGRFSEAVWCVAKGLGSAKLMCIDPQSKVVKKRGIGVFVVGHGAVDLARNGCDLVSGAAHYIIQSNAEGVK